MSPTPEAAQAAHGDDATTTTAARSPSPEETPDMDPPRTLTDEEAAEDYQKQLALLAEQEKEYGAEQASRSHGSGETADETPSQTLPDGQDEAGFKRRVALVEQQGKATVESARAERERIQAADQRK